MAVGETTGIQGTLERLRDLFRWRAMYAAWRKQRIDNADARRIERERKKRLRASEKLENRLRGNLRKELRKCEKLIIDRLARLGFSHVTVRDKKRKVSKVKFAQTAASPTNFYLRVDTVRMPWGKGINTTEMSQDYVLQDLSLAVKMPVNVYAAASKGFWFVVERAPKPEMQEYVDVLLEMPKSTGPTDIPLGIDVNRKLKHAELAKMPHLLVAGTTGYGKSVFLHNVLCTLIQRARPDQVKLTLVDLAGGVEFGVYRRVPHLYSEIEPGTALATGDEDLAELPRSANDGPFRVQNRIYTEPEDVERLLQRVRHEVQRRMERFVSHDCRNIDHWNLEHRYKRGQRLPYWVIVIDELQNVMLDKGLRDECESLLAKIAAVSRKTGIILVIATQRPSVDVVTGLIKANFPARVAFNMASSHDSMTVLGNGDAASLGRPGLLIYQHATSYYTAQSPFLSAALVKDIVERVVTGAPMITELTHSVGKLDMVEWVVRENEGKFDIDEVYFAFKPRGVTHRDVRECSLAFIGQVVDIDGKFYKMRRHADGSSRFEEVPDEV